MVRGSARTAGWGLLVLALLAAPFAATSGASHVNKPSSVTTRRVGAGAYYRKIVNPQKHWVIHQITVDLKAATRIDVALAGGELGNTEVLSTLAGRNGAIAAINGDFGTRDRRPWNTYAQDGHLIQTERSWGRGLSVDINETQAFIGHPKMKVRLVQSGLAPIKVDRVNNGPATKGGIALFTSLGHKVEDTPPDSCSARLIPQGRPRLNRYGSVSQKTVVERVRCGADPMYMGDGHVVAARRRTNKANILKTLVEGQVARLNWGHELDQSVDLIGGNPMIVDNGKIVGDTVYNCGYLCKLHPRSGVGITSNGKLLMVVVDGRQEGVRGMYLHELARYFVKRGAERAMTFDGGGAAEMWIRGKVVSTPSDGRERRLVNALLVLGPEPTKEPASATRSNPLLPFGLETYSTPSYDALDREAFETAAADPGSLGGLADFLSRRGTPIPRWMEEVARDMRSAGR
jgi:hypothetical protein